MKFLYTILSVLLMTSCIGITSNAGTTTTNWKEVSVKGAGPLITPPRIEDYISFDDPEKNAELRKKYLADLIEYNKYLNGYIANLSNVSEANGVVLPVEVQRYVVCHQPLTIVAEEKPKLPESLPSSEESFKKNMSIYIRQLWNYQQHFETQVNDELRQFNSNCL